jgi:K+-transporting ATPase A subunit
VEKEQNLTRGSLLAKLAMAPLVIGALAALQSEADAKAAQSAVQYQNKPKDGKKCSQCRFYVNGKTKTSNGACTQVNGSISPNGYCIVFAAGDNSKNKA